VRHARRGHGRWNTKGGQYSVKFLVRRRRLAERGAWSIDAPEVRVAGKGVGSVEQEPRMAEQEPRMAEQVPRLAEQRANQTRPQSVVSAILDRHRCTSPAPKPTQILQSKNVTK